jgi:hypothetical protein
MIFISHASQDVGHARTLAGRLKEKSVETFLAADDMLQAENIRQIILDKIALCQEFWLLVSRSSQNSRWNWWELGAACTLRKPIVPIRIGLRAEQIEDDFLKGLHMGDIDLPDEILIAYEGRLAKRSKLFGLYNYKAYNGLIMKEPPIYQGQCKIERSSPPEGTERTAGFEWLTFDGLRTDDRGRPVSEGWAQKWAAICPDGRIRVQYRFVKRASQPPSFTSLTFLPDKEQLMGKYMVMGGKAPKQGVVCYEKAPAPPAQSG